MLPLTRAAADFVCNTPAVCEKVEQVVFEKLQVAGYRTEVQQLCYFKFCEC